MIFFFLTNYISQETTPLDEISWLVSQLANGLVTNVLSYNNLPPKTFQLATFNIHAVQQDTQGVIMSEFIHHVC